MRRSSLLLGASAVVASVALTACGAHDVSGSAIGSNGVAAQGGSTATGGQIRTMDDLANAVGSDVNHKNSVHLTMSADLPGAGSMSGSGDASFAQPVSEQLTMSAQGMQIKMILLDNAFYMDVPELQQATGKPWLKIDGSGNDPVDQAFGSMIKLTQQNADPSQILTQLEGAGTLQSTTQETVDGQATTHYKVQVDVNKMIAKQTDPTTKQLLQQAQAHGMGNYPVDVWLANSDNLPVKMQVVTPTADATGSATQVTMTMNFTNWGEPVHITAPPADQVGSFSDIPGMSGGH
jgi:hypothetical protein